VHRVFCLSNRGVELLVAQTEIKPQDGHEQGRQRNQNNRACASGHVPDLRLHTPGARLAARAARLEDQIKYTGDDKQADDENDGNNP
jgi:hypothetical protein